MIGDAIATALEVAAALDEAGVDYLVGGSLASSMMGESRSTADIDLVVRLSVASVPALVTALGSGFFVDPKSLERAARQGTAANIFHERSLLKIDLFVLGPTPFEQGQMARRRRIRVAADPDRYLYTYTPEDIVLQKLRWYRMGNEVSDRQWRDVVSVLRLSDRPLDAQYLEVGAKEFGVSDLLERALDEAS